MAKNDKRKFFEASHKFKDISIFKVLTASVLSAVILTGFLYSGMFNNANLYLSDKMYQKERVLEGNIFVLGIDERALQNIGPFHTWQRSTMADVIRALNASENIHPAVIGIDVMYFGNSDEENDRSLAEACEEYDNVVVASKAQIVPKLVEDGDSFYVDEYAIEQLEVPYDDLRNVTSMGHINTMAGSDGVIRHALQYIDLPEEVQQTVGIERSESFAYTIYKKYAEATGLPLDIKTPMGDRYEWYIPYSGLPGSYGDGFSVWDLLAGDLPPEIFADSVVLIGPYTSGLSDSFNASIDKTRQMYGVEIHANILDAMIRNEYREELPKEVGIAIVFVMLLLLFLPFYMLNTLLSAPLMTGICVLYFFIGRQMVFPFNDNWFLFNNNGISFRYMLPPVYLPLGVVLLYIGILIVNFITTQKQKRQVTETFKKYVDPAIIDDIFDTGLDHLQLGGRNAEICVMFVDIRGFTPIS